MPFVYILRSIKDGGLYTGSTTDLEKRLREHQLGRCRSTKHRRPLNLVYYKEYGSIGEARIREKALKHSTLGKNKEALIANFPPEKLAQFKGKAFGRGASA